MTRAWIVIALLQQAPATPAPWWGWPTVAEAWTAPGERSTIKAAHRMFTVPDMPSDCAKGTPPARLAAKATTLYVGEWFDFSSLRIVAVDAEDRILPPVPIALDVEEVDPPLFRRTNEASGDGGVTPARAGRFRFHARTICPGMSADVIFSAVVRTR